MSASLKLKNFYPKWFPYPISWLRVLLSVLVLGPVGLSMTMASFSLGAEVLWLGTIDVFNASGVSALLIVISIAVGFPVILLTYTYQILTIIFNAKSLSPRLPRWIPSSSSWQQGLTATLVVGFSFLICFILLSWYRPDLMLENEYWRQPQLDHIVEAMIPIWFIIAAYLHHWDDLIRKKRATKRRRKVKKVPSVVKYSVTRSIPKPIAKPIDDVDIELDRMRGKLGLIQMQRRRSK